MPIVLASTADIDAILTIVQQTIAEMKTYGNDQWDHTYPLRERFVMDVGNRALYVFKENDTVMGFMVVDNDEPEEYGAIAWRSDRPCFVIHRWAVSSYHRQKGVASALEAFACELARTQRITYLKADTHSTNQRMQTFLQRRNYHQVGAMLAMGKDKPFYFYDKLL